MEEISRAAAGTKIFHDHLRAPARSVEIMYIIGEEYNTVLIAFKTPRVGTDFYNKGASAGSTLTSVIPFEAEVCMREK